MPHVEGIVELALRTPFLIGPVNVWLIEDDPLTLVDTGPNTGSALLQLRDELAARRHRIEDLGRIIITHQHLDHSGLVGPLVALSGAEVVAAVGMDTYLGDGQSAAIADERWSQEFMRAYGVPGQLVDGWWAARPDVTGYSSPASGVRTVGEGDIVAFAGRELHVRERPGHSPSDIVLQDGDRGVLFAGDHLLAGSPPMALAHPGLPGVRGRGILDPTGWSGMPDGQVRTSAMLTLRDSLRRTRELGTQLAFTGHGAPITDVAANVTQQLAGHERVAAGVLRELLRGPGTAHELVGRTAGRAHPYFGLCVVIGALDLLVADGLAHIAPDGGTPRYAAR